MVSLKDYHASGAESTRVHETGPSSAVAQQGPGTMAAGPADDIPTQLAALLGRETIQIRRTDQNPPQASIYDVISAVTGLNGNHAGKAYRDLTARYPEVHSVGMNFRFAGRGQRDTPVASKDLSDLL